MEKSNMFKKCEHLYTDVRSVHITLVLAGWRCTFSMKKEAQQNDSILCFYLIYECNVNLYLFVQL